MKEERNDMIGSTSDLKRRAVVESNVMKSLVLSESSRPYAAPRLDDIMLHEYQIASSTTLNTVFMNYIVDLKWANGLLNGEASSSGTESYF